MPELPTPHSLHNSAYANQDYMVCATCHGMGRAGKATPDAEGNISYPVIPCWVCHGDRVMLKSRPELRLPLDDSLQLEDTE
jgi:hypothetical protein